MSERPRAVSVNFDSEHMYVFTDKGECIAVPVTAFHRLASATHEQRMNYRIFAFGVGLNWPDIDEDLSVSDLYEKSKSGAW